MVQVFTEATAKDLGLKGPKSLEIISGLSDKTNVTLRLVEVPVSKPDEVLRGPHRHTKFEEYIYILSGQGTMETDTRNHHYKLALRLLSHPANGTSRAIRGQIQL